MALGASTEMKYLLPKGTFIELFPINDVFSRELPLRIHTTKDFLMDEDKIIINFVLDKIAYQFSRPFPKYFSCKRQWEISYFLVQRHDLIRVSRNLAWEV